MSAPLKRWNLKFVDNMRDLGGFACSGGTTRYGKLLRADYIGRLTEEEKKLLIDKELRDVLDLRGKDEQRDFPNPFLNSDIVKVYNFSAPTDRAVIRKSAADFTCMGEDYIQKIDNFGDYYVNILDVISKSEGLVIFHCMAGKDRTGIVAALILLALGVDERDVVADYKVSDTYLKYQLKEFFNLYPEILPYMMKSDASNMEMMIEHINEKYGDTLKYLRKNGFTDEQYERLNKCLVV